MESRQNREEPKTPAPIWEQPDPSDTPGQGPDQEPPGDEPTITPKPGSGGAKPSGK